MALRTQYTSLLFAGEGQSRYSIEHPMTETGMMAMLITFAIEAEERNETMYVNFVFGTEATLCHEIRYEKMTGTELKKLIVELTNGDHGPILSGKVFRASKVNPAS